jgi:hypothetical protein
MQVEAVWLVGQVPQEIRQQLNLPKDGKGIDGVFQNADGHTRPLSSQVQVTARLPHLHADSAVPRPHRASDRPHHLHELVRACGGREEP